MSNCGCGCATYGSSASSVCPCQNNVSNTQGCGGNQLTYGSAGMPGYQTKAKGTGTVVSVIVIGLAIVGGYYLWNTRGKR